MSRRIVLLSLFLLSLSMLLAGCFQQAGEAFQPVSITTAPTEAQQSAPTDPGTAAPTPEPLPMDSVSPTTEAPAVESPTAAPPPVDSGGGLSSVEATPTFGVAITIISPTREVPPAATIEGAVIPAGATEAAPDTQFVTPSSPLGPVTQEAIIPLGSVSATPSGLITPTALGEPSSATTPATGSAGGGSTTLDSSQPGCLYTVERGDTLFRIAVRNNTTVAELRSANPQISGDIIQPGQELKIPNCGVEQPSVSAPPAAEDTPAPNVPSGGTTYAVKPGDTLFTIAQRYGVTVQAIVSANNLSNPNRLDVGQQLIIPPPPN